MIGETDALDTYIFKNICIQNLNFEENLNMLWEIGKFKKVLSLGKG